MTLSYLNEIIRSTLYYNFCFIFVILQENGIEFEAQIVAKFDALSRLVDEQKCKLLEYVSSHAQDKCRSLKEQSATCKEKLKNTTGLLQYTFEVLKENDPATFLLVSKF